MKDMKEGQLSYNSSNDRYGLLVAGIWENSGFHCNECFEVEVDGEWVVTRIEKSWSGDGSEWYLENTPYHGNLENIRARIG